MKKILLTLMIIASTAAGMMAQTSGGPDAYGYIWRDSNDPNGPTYNWIDITTLPNVVQVTGLQDDNFVGPFAIPAFQYYYYTVNKIWIGSNGYVAFNNGNIASPFPSIPNTAAPQNYLAVMMADFNFTDPGNTGQCYYWISPNQDSVIVTYNTVPFWANATPAYTGSNTFQVILNYNDSSITYQYQTQTGTTQGTADYMGIGIENISGSIGLEWGHDQYPPTNYAIRFYAPASSTLQINDVAANFNLNPDNGAVIRSKNGNPLTIGVDVKNTGNTTVALFNTITVVRNVANQLQVRDTTPVGPLSPGQNQFVVQPKQFNPTVANTYKLTTTLALAGDAVTSNNEKVTEIVVVDTTVASIELAYDNGVEAGAGGISWSGGNGGAANYFIPPFYPCKITQGKAYIIADPNSVGYFMKVYADDGPNHSAGTLLDSAFVDPATIALNAFNTTTFTNPIRIDSGGFYMTWYMGGDQVALGQNTVVPISNRTFEVLSNSFAPYRSGETTDHMIRAVITNFTAGISEIDARSGIGQFYPNPSNGITTIDINKAVLNTDKLTMSLYDINGKLIRSQIVSAHDGRVNVETKSLNAGLYNVSFTTPTSIVSRKLEVVK